LLGAGFDDGVFGLVALDVSVGDFGSIVWDDKAGLGVTAFGDKAGFLLFDKAVFLVGDKAGFFVFLVFGKAVFFVFDKAVFLLFDKAVFFVFGKAVFLVDDDVIVLLAFWDVDLGLIVLCVVVFDFLGFA